MPKKYRLSLADFIRFARMKSTRVHGALFSLTITPLPDTAGVKTACVVSKKVSVHAVDRNGIERHLRESLRPLLPHIKKPVALIFHAKREARTASSAEIARDVVALLREAHVRGTILTQ